MSISHAPNLQYSFKSPRHQRFSLPSDVITMILNNCDSPQLFQKLQITCKYFFHKKKVIVIDTNMHWGWNYKHYYFKKDNEAENEEQDLVKNYQYWLNGSFHLGTNRNISERLKYLYRCNLKTLIIRAPEKLIYDEVSLLIEGGDIEELYIIDGTDINYADGKPVTIDAFLSKCPKIRKLYYQNKSESFSSATFEKLYQLQFINKFETFSLVIDQVQKQNPNQIDPSSFCKFLKKNLAHSAKLFIRFNCYVSNFENFQTFVNSILKNDLTKIKILQDF